MPDPFAIPTISISVSSILQTLLLTLVNVSVVLIAVAALAQSRFFRGLTNFKLFIIILGSNCFPITPVEAVYISFILQFDFVDRNFIIFETVSSPFLPVNAFAFPELTKIALTVGSLHSFRFFLQ